MVRYYFGFARLSNLATKFHLFPAAYPYRTFDEFYIGT